VPGHPDRSGGGGRGGVNESRGDVLIISMRVLNFYAFEAGCGSLPMRLER
jgi:hypothetical protein